MIGRYRDGVVPDAQPPEDLLAEFAGLAEAVRERIDEVELTAALDEIWQRIKRLNRYVQDEEPWQLSKDEEQAGRLDQVLFTLAEGLRVVSVLLHPFIPGSTERLLAALGQDDLSLDNARLGALGGGAEIGELAQLFPRVDAPEPSAAR
ncbi:MAG: class I tRNA ligase family protein [Thermoleophilaceae bacterium]